MRFALAKSGSRPESILKPYSQSGLSLLRSSLELHKDLCGGGVLAHMVVKQTMLETPN